MKINHFYFKFSKLKSFTPIHYLKECITLSLFFSLFAIGQVNGQPLCDFIITQARCIEGTPTEYEICVQATVPGTNFYWELVDINIIQAPVIATGTGATTCFNTTQGIGQYGIYLTVDDFTPCYQPLVIECTGCPETLFTYEVDMTSCQELEVTIQPNFTGVLMNLRSIFVDFGDGTDVTILNDFNNPPIVHTYDDEGDYEVCFTFHQSVPEERTLTCCYPISIEFPEECECPADLIEKCDQDCEVVTLCITDPDFNDGDPFIIDLDDGSGPFTTTDLEFDVTYPNVGTYNVCITYDVLDITKTCCYDINYTTECCTTSDFEFSQLPIETSPSCYNPEFVIDPVCKTGLPNKHFWEFGDGTTYEGIFPPSPYMFTDFVNENGEVCVTHRIECCDQVLTTTKCLPLEPGAYIGRPEEERRMTDLVPTSSWGPTVYDFIFHYATHPTIPLVIDGILINDRNSLFLSGTWNFGTLAVVENRGFRLTFHGVTLRSAGEMGGIYDNCCIWQGIWNYGDTYVLMDDCYVRQAQAAIHYPSRSAASPPFLSITDSEFINNLFTVKSLGQHVYIDKFHNNTLVGIDHFYKYCACGAVNAIDFRNIPQGYTEVFRPGDLNTIRNYEQAFHFENSSLEAYDFYVHSLNREFLTGWNDNPSWNDASVGIDFRWDQESSGQLTFDDFEFKDLVEGDDDRAGEIAVDILIRDGHVDVDADAHSLGSIKAWNLRHGYMINTEASGTIAGSIENNVIESDRGGITMVFREGTSNNHFLIEDNDIDVAGAGLEGTGIAISSPWPASTQDIDVHSNDIKVDDGTLHGSAIFVNSTHETEVWENTIEPGSAHGIQINTTEQSRFSCNDIDDVDHGILVVQSPANDIVDNDVFACNHSLTYHGANSSGSYIAGNDFQIGAFEEITYEATSITGPQLHTKFNNWIGQFTGGSNAHEVRHDGGFGERTNCRFFVPDNQITGDVNRPSFNSLVLEEETPLPADLSTNCLQIFNPGGGGFFTNPDDPGSIAMMTDLINGGMNLSGYSAAEQEAWKQSIFRYMLDYPAISTANTILNSFYLQAPSTFTGQSIELEKLLQDMEGEWSNYQGQITALRQSFELEQQNLETLMTTLYDINGNVDPVVSANVQLSLSNLSNLETQMATIKTAYESTVSGYLAQAVLDNNALSATLDHELYEQFINGLYIKKMQNIDWTTTEINELRAIAQTCFTNGGRAVYAARGILWTELGEYYGKVSCTSSNAANNANESVEESTTTLLIAPNPTMGQTRLKWEVERTGNIVDLRISDITGKSVMAKNRMESRTGNFVIDTQGWMPGIYVVEVEGERFTYRSKMIVQQ